MPMLVDRGRKGRKKKELGQKVIKEKKNRIIIEIDHAKEKKKGRRRRGEKRVVFGVPTLEPP